MARSAPRGHNARALAAAATDGDFTMLVLRLLLEKEGTEDKQIRTDERMHRHCRHEAEQRYGYSTVPGDVLHVNVRCQPEL